MANMSTDDKSRDFQVAFFFYNLKLLCKMKKKSSQAASLFILLSHQINYTKLDPLLCQQHCGASEGLSL